MNYKEAFKILEIDFINTKYDEITLEYINKRYRKMALKHHPDKNGNTEESNERFKKINEAYNYLINLYNETNDNNDVEKTTFSQSSLYADILKQFIKY